MQEYVLEVGGPGCWLVSAPFFSVFEPDAKLAKL